MYPEDPPVGTDQGTLQFHGRVMETHPMWAWLPGRCHSSLDMQKTHGISRGKFYPEAEGQG